MPVVASSVPIYNWLINQLEDYEEFIDISDEMRIAITQAKNKLLQYYNKTDASLYAITTSKHCFIYLFTHKLYQFVL